MSGLITDLSAIGSIDRTTDVLEIVDVSANTSYKVTVNNLLGITGGSVVSTTDTQTVQNKAVDNTNTVTVKATNLVIQDGSDTSKQAKFIASGITTATTRSYTLPDASTTLVGTGVTQTLTNKTLTSPTITGGTIDNTTITVDAISGHTSSTIVTVANLQISNGVLNTNNSVVTANITDSAITPAKLLAGTGSGWSWQTFTPTFSNVAIGNGTLTSSYTQIGKTILMHINWIWGSTSSMSSTMQFSLPVTSVSYVVDTVLIGAVAFINTGVATYQGNVVWNNTTSAFAYVSNVSGTYLNDSATSATIPFTFVSGSKIDVWAIYEAA